jgi:hypothetical protein
MKMPKIQQAGMTDTVRGCPEGLKVNDFKGSTCSGNFLLFCRQLSTIQSVKNKGKQ